MIKMEPKISVIIPLYNSEKTIRKTLESIRQQRFKDYELIVADDCSTDESVKIAKQYKPIILQNPKNSGPAVTRNKGIKKAKGKIIAFIDSDAWAEKDWLEKINERFSDPSVKVIMGATKIPRSTYIGDSISGLGFPGGANLGFEKMWKVKNGKTDHITSCNFAIRAELMKENLFDESFPLPGGEDPELSFRLAKKGMLANYYPDIIVNHIPITSLKKWAKWQIKRGRSNYHFQKKVGKIGGFIKLRIWSSKNVLMHHKFSLKLPMISMLLGTSFFLQQLGYIIEKHKKE